MRTCPSCGSDLTGTPKFCPECGTKLEAAAAPLREARKVVTVLFSDVAGSTALGEQLDPEALRTLMGRYFAAMKAVLERHGGTVEKFIGDAIMAVFGIPTLHEDDALRAVRAAAQMREALAALNRELAAERGVTIRTRTGIMTGEVVAGDPSAGQTLVTGDTVNTAARLEQAASPGEILIGEPTWRLVRDAVSAEPVEAVSAKGKALPIPARRLVSVAGGTEGHARRMDAPLVGRERELARLEQTWREAVEQRSPQLFTLLGAAGVGKSRLVTEFLTSVADHARILRGRCLPYGEGITYWPLAEALRDEAGMVDADDRASAQRKLHTLVDGERDAELLAARLATAIGLSDESAAQPELFWAVRRTFEHLARQRPTVVVFEDIHWAEPTFLDLIDHLAEWSRDAPLLLLAPARPDLLDARRDWGGGKLNATTVLLEALRTDAVARLVDALPGGNALPESVRARVVAAAEGNPLFVEELLAMLVDDGSLRLINGRWEADTAVERLAIPPTIQALLAARLDRLTNAERRVAEHASVVGRVFEPEAVASLLADTEQLPLDAQLMALVRKELVRPDRSEVTGGDAFKFRHILIRDAAYNALPKRDRADLHERFAGWLEQAAGERVTEFGEIVGHHLEQAHEYRAELGMPSVGLPDRAVTWLARAAWQAVDRGDAVSAASTFRRAASLEVRPSARAETLMDAAWALRRGGLYREASAVAADLREYAQVHHLGAVALRAELFLADLETFADSAAIPRLNALVAEAETRVDDLADLRTTVEVKAYRSTLLADALRYDDAAAEARQVLELAVANRWRFLAAGAAGHLVMGSMFGSRHVGELRDEFPTLPSVDGWLTSDADGTIAALTILISGYADAEPAISAARDRLVELGAGQSKVAVHETTWATNALLSGDPGAAVRHTTRALRGLAGGGNDYFLRTAQAVAGEALIQLGRPAEAEDQLTSAVQADASDLITHVTARRAMGRLALSRGDPTSARREVARAHSLLDGIQAPLDESETLIASAEIQDAIGSRDEARAALQAARDLMARKGADAVVRRIDALLARMATDAQSVSGQ